MTGTDIEPGRRRPRNRKAQILGAAAEAFSDRGYYPVGIDDIAATVGISGPALYRHFPTKYALFVHTVMRLSDSLLAATDPAVIERTTPRDSIDAVMQALTRTTLDNRRTGGLYRWESRYLAGSDKASLRAKVAELRLRVKVPLRELRPELSDEDAALMATAAFSVMASITSHRSALSAKQIERLIVGAAWSVLLVDLPSVGGSDVLVDAATGSSSKREVLLRESILLFYRNGYHDVSLDDIGAAAGMNASSVYRYFPSKAELLAAAFHRANERLTATLRDAVSGSESPLEVIEKWTRSYTELTFVQGELVAVYFAEMGNLPDDQRSNLRNVQRSNIEEWALLLRSARPELGAVAARFLVHAAIGLVFDVGRSVRFDRSPRTMARVQRLMTAVLLG